MYSIFLEGKNVKDCGDWGQNFETLDDAREVCKQWGYVYEEEGGSTYDMWIVDSETGEEVI